MQYLNETDTKCVTWTLLKAILAKTADISIVYSINDSSLKTDLIQQIGKSHGFFFFFVVVVAGLAARSLVGEEDLALFSRIPLIVDFFAALIKYLC